MLRTSSASVGSLKPDVRHRPSPASSLVISTFILMASLVLLQAIVEVVEACMKGEGANARKHVRLRTPHPSPCLCRTYPVSMLALQVGVGPSGSC